MRKQIEKPVPKAFRLDGADAQPEITRQTENFFFLLFKIQPFKTVPANVYAGKHNFFVAKINNPANVFQNFIYRTTFCSASNFWDDAERAEVIAAIMDFYPASGVKGFIGRFVIKKVGIEIFGMNDFALKMAVNQ